MTNREAEDVAERPHAHAEGRGRNPQEYAPGASSVTARRGISGRKQTQLMEAVVGRENLTEALRRVEKNKGVAGVDDMPVSEL